VCGIASDLQFHAAVCATWRRRGTDDRVGDESLEPLEHRAVRRRALFRTLRVSAATVGRRCWARDERRVRSSSGGRHGIRNTAGSRRTAISPANWAGSLRHRQHYRRSSWCAVHAKYSSASESRERVRSSQWRFDTWFRSSRLKTRTSSRNRAGLHSSCGRSRRRRDRGADAAERALVRLGASGIE
jgi:hypothetical protein